MDFNDLEWKSASVESCSGDEGSSILSIHLFGIKHTHKFRIIDDKTDTCRLKAPLSI